MSAVVRSMPGWSSSVLRSTMPLRPNDGTGHAGLRVQRDEVIAGRDSENALVPLAVGPVRDAAARSLARRPFTALALVHAPHPQLLARLGIDRDDRAPHAGLRVHDAVHHERRHLHVVVGPHAVVVGLEPPRDAQVLDVVFVDLVERGVLRAAGLAGIRPPFAVRRAVLRGQRDDGDDEQTCERKEPARHEGSLLCEWGGLYAVQVPVHDAGCKVRLTLICNTGT